jgi:hypothetical protein
LLLSPEATLFFHVKFNPEAALLPDPEAALLLNPEAALQPNPEAALLLNPGGCPRTRAGWRQPH